MEMLLNGLMVEYSFHPLLQGPCDQLEELPLWKAGFLPQEAGDVELFHSINTYSLRGATSLGSQKFSKP